MKNEMLETIAKHGIDFTAKMLAEYINEKIASEEVARQFVLEELEAASQGNQAAKLFAFSSGFDEDDYTGAMHNSFEEVDGPDGPQQEILNLCLMLSSDPTLMAGLRIRTVDNIMKEWKLGKYSAINNDSLINVVKRIENHEWGVFANIINDVGVYLEEYGDIDKESNVLRFMAYAYVRRTAAAGLFLQGYLDKEDYVDISQNFKSIQQTTGYSTEFQIEAAQQSTELLLSYSSRLNQNIISKITSAVELNQAVPTHENNIYYDFDRVIDFFEDDFKEKIIKDKYGNSYKEIVSPYTRRIWLDRNLGAKRVPISINDSEGFGDYFQWGRDSDGHEKVDSSFTDELSEISSINHEKFILAFEDNRYDWVILKNDNLWQGVNGENNPCPEGYRLPTLEEIVEETYVNDQTKNYYDAYKNFLKLPTAGAKTSNSADVIYTGQRTMLWTSNINGESSVAFGFSENDMIKIATGRASGIPIRCIKN